MPSFSLKQRFKLSRFFKGELPTSGIIKLTQRRVFILPTLRGLGMVLTIVLLLLLAYIYNNNLVYMLAFLLASIFFVVILHTFRTLAGLLVQSGYVQPVFAGEAAGFNLTLKNPGTLARKALTAKLETEIGFSLDPGESQTLMLYVATSRRGWQEMTTVTLASTYPLGTFRAWSPLRFDSKVLVYPKPSLLTVPFPLGGGEQTAEQVYINRTGRDDFNGIRSYQRGDSLRQIHWKAYAKGQGLQTKQYASTSGGTELWLDFENIPGAHLEERLSQLCRWIIDAEQAGYRYGLLIPGSKISPGNGQQHYSACLTALALF